LLSWPVYKQELNCDMVGYYEAVEKTYDLFRPAVACAVLFLSVCSCIFCFILVYLRWLYNWHLCSYVNKYINNYWIITIFFIGTPMFGCACFSRLHVNNKRVDMKRGMNISINDISHFWFLIAYRRCYKVDVQTCEAYVTQVLHNAGSWNWVLQRGSSQNKHIHLATLVVWNSAMPTSWKEYLALH
jgi:hypothetical protein